MSNQIQPIKFQRICEDQTEFNGNTRLASPPNRQKLNEEHDQHAKRKPHHPLNAKIHRQNFSLEYTYPAVIFDEISFSVDRSQQQANFLQECFYRTGRSLGSLFGGGGDHEQENNRKIEILKSINLNVPYGSIFGLLGPSSCGKTTLLRCLVGLLEPTSGSIRLFGHQLNGCKNDLNLIGRLFGSWAASLHNGNTRANKSKVPGANVGYMPQDLGLYEDFTIRQILTMFGRYMRMDTKLIESRIEFMAQFLELPDVERQIESLSGGQKRRVSFAIACLHMPPLIILDEPTVGVDPLLRQSIWKYLRRLADEENRTIIITTHYIEEAAQADQVALMRAGEILVQDTPAKIMQSNGSKTLEEAFLKICNNVDVTSGATKPNRFPTTRLCPQPKINWATTTTTNDNLGSHSNPTEACQLDSDSKRAAVSTVEHNKHSRLNQLKLRAQEKLELFDEIESQRIQSQPTAQQQQQQQQFDDVKLTEGLNDQLSMSPNLTNAPHLPVMMLKDQQQQQYSNLRELDQVFSQQRHSPVRQTYDCDYGIATKQKRLKFLNRQKLKLNNIADSRSSLAGHDDHHHNNPSDAFDGHASRRPQSRRRDVLVFIERNFKILCALLYKNYRRNVNSLPLIAFQFMLPIIQMISFSLCVGGRPTNIGLGLVNNDQPPIDFAGSELFLSRADSAMVSLANGSSMPIIEPPPPPSPTLADDYSAGDASGEPVEMLSLKYLNFIDNSMISIKPYGNLREAIEDVRRAKLWAVMEIGANFSTSISRRFNLENFYQLDLDTIQQSVIKLYPDRSNKILDMICQRSLVDSYRKFLLSHFEHFKRLPIEVKEPIFDIGANVISNSIDGYTESIAPGLLASLTYIMAAGLTTFIMVVERGAGILERTYTCGINPVAYLVAHAIFRSFFMMLQIALVLMLTFYVLKQPLVGSLGLAYLMLMTLNVTGITYGLLISSIVTDQNGAALTIVSSLVVKITLSGILWPLEAIPTWLRTVCYIQPLTMPVQALKSIILKGATIGDRSVNLGFLVSLSWLVLFITISAKRFKFYQH